MAKNDLSGKRAHVVKRDSGWAVRKEGAKKASKVYKTQADAVRGARVLKKSGSDVVIHKRDGSILKWEKSSKKR